jgi:hypothetical protein
MPGFVEWTGNSWPDNQMGIQGSKQEGIGNIQKDMQRVDPWNSFLVLSNL